MKTSFTSTVQFTKKQERIFKKMAKAQDKEFQDFVEEFVCQCVVDFKDPQKEIDAKCKEVE